MFIKQLSLYKFRNINSAKISPVPGINIFYGANGAGKTNILEAVYFCAVSRSQRTSADGELIMFGEPEAHIQTLIDNDGRTDKIDAHLKRFGKKGVAVNGVPVKKLNELYGTLYAVIFSHEDLKLLKASPGERRRFIDMELCQLSGVYYYNLSRYYKVLKERNNLLKSIHQKTNDETLSVWDAQLVEYGAKIIAKREEYVQTLNEAAGSVHKLLTGETLRTVYEPNVPAAYFESKLQKARSRDIQQGNTSVGPHRDDLTFLLNDTLDAKIFGSQGQQRTVALSLKLSEIQIIKQEKLTTPVLLLDDVLSELDSARQTAVLDNIFGTQIILTCTGVEHMLDEYAGKGKVFMVENGAVRTG